MKSSKSSSAAKKKKNDDDDDDDPVEESPVVLVRRGLRMLKKMLDDEGGRRDADEEDKEHEDDLKIVVKLIKRRLATTWATVPRWVQLAMKLGLVGVAVKRPLAIVMGWAYVLRWMLQLVFFLVIKFPVLILLLLLGGMVILSMVPSLLGYLFTTLITRYVLAGGSPATISVPKIEARAISITAYFERGSATKKDTFANTGALMFHIVVRGFKFGNPPGFRRDHMLSVEHVNIVMAIPLATLRALPRLGYDVVFHKTMWSPWPSFNDRRRLDAEDFGTSVAEAARRNGIPAIRFERFDFDDVDLNFEMHHGELNINGITRLLAEAHAFAGADRRLSREAARKKTTTTDSDDDSDDDDSDVKKLPRPNQLVVKILKVRGLFTTKGHHHQRPQQQKKTKSGTGDGSPKPPPNPPTSAEAASGSPENEDENEDDEDDDEDDDEETQDELYSGPVQVEVKARSEKGTAKGTCSNGEAEMDPASIFRLQVTDPSTVIRLSVKSESVRCQWVMTAKWLVSAPTYCEGDVEAMEDGLKGWVTLRDRRGRKFVGKPPEVYIELAWKHVVGAFVAGTAPALTAMEQIASDGDETALRMGDLKAVRRMLRDFPLRVDVWRCTIRDMELHIKDLFMGRRGQAEVGDGARDAIILPLTDMKAVLRNDLDKSLDPRLTFGRGIDLDDFLLRFFKKGVAPQLMRQNAINQSLSQSTAAFAKQLWVGGNLMNFFSSSSSSRSSSSSSTSSAQPETTTNDDDPEPPPAPPAEPTTTAAAFRILGAQGRDLLGASARKLQDAVRRKKTDDDHLSSGFVSPRTSARRQFHLNDDRDDVSSTVSAHRDDDDDPASGN